MPILELLATKIYSMEMVGSSLTGCNNKIIIDVVPKEIDNSQIFRCVESIAEKDACIENVLTIQRKTTV